jgi:hypothetical protein
MLHAGQSDSATARGRMIAGGVSLAQTEMIPSRLEAHETAHGMGQFTSRAGTCKQRWRGALLVRNTYG